MKEIKDLKLDNKLSEEEFVVNGEGCLDDCPKLSSWMPNATVAQVKCNNKGTPFISKKR